MNVIPNLTATEIRNKYGLKLWYAGVEQIKNHGDVETGFLGESLEPVDIEKLLVILRSNTSLYDKLSRLFRVTEGRMWFPNNNLFSSFINSGEKMQFQYSQILATLADILENQIMDLTNKDIEKILKVFNELDQAKEKYFSRIGFRSIDFSKGISDYTSLITPEEDNTEEERIAPSVQSTNIKLYKQHNQATQYIDSIINRQEIIGSGMPARYK